MDTINKSIEIKDTGVTVNRHEINPNVYYNVDTNQLMIVINSYVGNNKKPARAPRVVIPEVKPSDDFKKVIIDYVTANIETILNPPAK